MRTKYPQSFLPVVLAAFMLVSTSCHSQSEPNPHSIDTATLREKYDETLANLHAQRQTLVARYKQATNSNEKAAVLEDSRKLVSATLNEKIFPSWYGTPWAFSGTAAKPGEGAIACGYFVSTTLRHAGFHLDRYKIAQQASQKIIGVFSDKADIKILAGGKPMEVVIEHIRDSGDGLYIVGLDTHVGFVENRGGQLRFVHSSYYDPPKSVISEPVTGTNPLADSQYRVIGKVLGDEMMRKWLLGEEFSL